MMAGCLMIRDREDIYACLVEDREMPGVLIARLVGAHPSTISRELSRNGGRCWYRPSNAQLRADLCRRRPRASLSLDTELGRRVRAKLEVGYSPAGTARLLTTEGFGVAAETIYRAVYDGRLELNSKDCLRTRRRQRRHRHTQATTNPEGNYLGDFQSIHERPDTTGMPGHWEGDLIIGAWAKTAMITLIERISRYTVLIPLPNGKASRHVVGTLAAWAKTLPPIMAQSLTWDQGSELTLWPNLTDLFIRGVYFADRRSPWQRGLNEQNNGILRFFFPKGTGLADPDLTRTTHAMHILNTQPRRSLTWQTPTATYDHIVH